MFSLQIEETLLNDLMLTLESPDEGQVVSGISMVRGWIFPTRLEVQIGVISANPSGPFIPQCSERRDVQVAFPQLPASSSLNSGWEAVIHAKAFFVGDELVFDALVMTVWDKETQVLRGAVILVSKFAGIGHSSVESVGR